SKQFGNSGFSTIDTIYITNSGLIVGATFLGLDNQVFLMHLGSAPTYLPTLRTPCKPNASDAFVANNTSGGFSLYETSAGVQDLMAQLPSSCSVKLEAPLFIADGGLILATGAVNGTAHGFLIIP